MYVLPFGVIKNKTNSYTYNLRKLKLKFPCKNVVDKYTSFQFSNPTSFHRKIGFNVYPSCKQHTIQRKISVEILLKPTVIRRRHIDVDLNFQIQTSFQHDF